MKKRFYVLLIEGDVEPSLIGPFMDSKDRDNEAIRLKLEHGDNSGIFALDTDTARKPEVWAYSNSFFEYAL